VAGERLANTEDEEIRVALEEIAKIARLRLEDAL
jgi:2-oxo-4-hydroxy-4-carboxy--5-ureidoimidazoline (OHCU) decarboxylase